jgi:hypothetical protein
MLSSASASTNSTDVTGRRQATPRDRHETPFESQLWGAGALESLMDCRSPRGVAFVAHASPSSGHGILPTVSTVRQQQRQATCTLLQSITPTDRGRRNGVMPWSTPSRPIAPRRCRTHRLQAAFAVVCRSFCSQGPGFVSVHRNLFSLALRSAQEHPLHRRGRTLSRSRCPAISSALDGN